MPSIRKTASLGAGKAVFLSASATVALLLCSGGALAQEETVVVSGSRLVTNGAEAPTPVTVVTTENLQLAAPRNLVDGLLQLPVFKGSVSVANQSTGTTSSNGAAYLNMRNLGTTRTLVLMDGRRVVPAASAGSVDSAQIPEALISRVDVVTGGASAAYGSDAVSGVVNYILNTKFEGLKAEAQTGISGYADNLNYRMALTGGAAFLNNRLHVVASFLDYKSNGVFTADRRPWTNRAIGVIANPVARNPALPTSPTNTASLVVTNPLSSVAAPGGLITGLICYPSPPAAACPAAGLLRGTTFGPDGQAMRFNYGTLVSGTQMQGGDGFNPNLLLTLQPSQRRDQFYTHVSYDVSDDISVYVQAMASQNHIQYRSLPTFELSATNFVIQRDNAYLPQSIKDVLAANPQIQSMTVGRTSPDIGIPFMDAITNSGMVTLGLDGKVAGTTWSYRTYGQMGRGYASYKTRDNPISDNLYRASDAVVVTSGNVGSSGLPLGSIVCRQSLSNPAPTAISNPVGCVPLNIFGPNNASAAALKYVKGTAIQIVRVAEDVAEFSASGELFDLPAGAVSLAFGGAYRREAFTQLTDAQSQEIRSGAGINVPNPSDPTKLLYNPFPTGLVGTLGGFERTNPQPTRGSYDVKEGFAELQVPLLKDVPLVRSLSLNLAGRYVDYSTSGGVKPWKIGLVWEPTDGLRLRASRSTDIRAPNLGELYQGSSQGTSTVQDPANGNASTNVITGAIGNVGLVPESANTSTIGLVFTPEQLLGGAAPGLTFSVDYYQINISKAISTLTAQQELNFCAAGSAQQCAFITRNSSNQLVRISLPFFNASARSTKGVDFEATYTSPLSVFDSDWDGTLVLRGLINYVGEFTTVLPGATPSSLPIVAQLAGDIGQSNPKWTGVFSANVDVGRIGVYLQERFVGGGPFDATNNNGLGVYPNHVGNVFYTDLTFNYQLFPDDGVSTFLSINNLFDRDPPATPSFLIAGSSYSNRTLYDLIGRQFTAGIRFRM
jgi:outer membrane receptor protein involved in Fe transport